MLTKGRSDEEKKQFEGWSSSFARELAPNNGRRGAGHGALADPRTGKPGVTRGRKATELARAGCVECSCGIDFNADGQLEQVVVRRQLGKAAYGSDLCALSELSRTSEGLCAWYVAHIISGLRCTSRRVGAGRGEGRRRSSSGPPTAQRSPESGTAGSSGGGRGRCRRWTVHANRRFPPRRCRCPPRPRARWS